MEQTLNVNTYHNYNSLAFPAIRMTTGRIVQANIAPSPKGSKNTKYC
jgi:hypothetical protein